MDATTIVFIALVVAAIAGVYVASLRATTIVDVVFEKGKLRVIRGGVAPPILADLRDIARDIDSGELRVLKNRGTAEVELKGPIDPRAAQRLRNVIGSVPLARLINARRK